MRSLPFIAGASMVLIVAGAVLAASPSPSPTPTPAPKATPAPTAKPTPSPATPSTSSSSSTTSTAATTFTAAIRPLDTTSGSATVVKNANGTGTMTLTLRGLRPDLPWVVDVDGGTIDHPTERAADEIAFRSGMGVERVSSDTVRIHLTATEMRDFLDARSGKGVVVLVSDGQNRSASTFTS